MAPEPYSYIKRTYGLSFVPGERVAHEHMAPEGTVARESKSQGHYVMVRFDGRKHASPCHPGELRRVPATRPADADAPETGR